MEHLIQILRTVPGDNLNKKKGKKYNPAFRKFFHKKNKYYVGNVFIYPSFLTINQWVNFINCSATTLHKYLKKGDSIEQIKKMVNSKEVKNV